MLFKHLITPWPLHTAILFLEVHLLGFPTLPLSQLHQGALEANVLRPGCQPVPRVGDYCPGNLCALSHAQKLVPAIRLHLPGTHSVAQTGLDDILQDET